MYGSNGLFLEGQNRLPLPMPIMSVSLSYLPVAVEALPVAVSYLSLVPDFKDHLLGIEEKDGNPGSGLSGELANDPDVIVLDPRLVEPILDGPRDGSEAHQTSIRSGRFPYEVL